MPILDAHTFEFFSKSPEQTRRLGMRLGALLQPGDLICLQGDLGAGKTTLVQGVARGWGALIGARHGEGYRVRGPVAIHDARALLPGAAAAEGAR